MDVIGARFADLPAALAARDAILASVAMLAADVAVRPLGTTRYDEPTEAFVLAGRFASAAAHRVVRLIRDHGGAIISRRTEWQPPLRPPVAAATRRPLAARGLAPRLRSALRTRPRRPSARLARPGGA